MSRAPKDARARYRLRRHGHATPSKHAAGTRDGFHETLSMPISVSRGMMARGAYDAIRARAATGAALSLRAKAAKITCLTRHAPISM